MTPLARKDRIDEQTVMMTVTELCNLNCRYCFEKVKTKRVMPESVMKEIIQRHMTQNNEFTGVVFDISGGEPLLEFDRIRRVINWFHETEWEKRHLFSIGTNATLFTDVIKSWFLKHRDCVVPCISLDGTKSAHDLNRSQSYDAVVKHVSFLKENWPDQSVKMTINADTLDQVADGIENIHSLGLKVEANVVFEDIWGQDTRKKQYLDIYREQLEQLVDFYTQHPELTPPRLVDKYLPILALDGQPATDRYCGAGKYMVSYTPDGEAYPCHRFTPFCSQRPSQIPYAAQTSTLGPPSCSTCLIQALCPTCQGFNWEENANVDERTTYHCDFVKLEVLASAKLTFNRLKSNCLSLSPDSVNTDQETRMMFTQLKAVKRVFSELDL